jgi:hypothetical protein
MGYVASFYESSPAEFVSGEESSVARHTFETEDQRKRHAHDEKVRQYVISWRNQLRMYRYEKLSVWNECWQIYRCQEDWSDKEDWQAKISLPKSFSSVKQATNVIKRFLNAAKKPFNLESENPNDLVAVRRSEQMTHLSEVFLEKARFLDEFSEALECGFIMGAGIVKLWWGLVPRVVTKVETKMVPQGLAGVTTADGNAPQGYVAEGGQAGAGSQQLNQNPTEVRGETQPSEAFGNQEQSGRGPTPVSSTVSGATVGRPSEGEPAQFARGDHAGTGNTAGGSNEPPEQQPLGAGVPVEAPASNRTTQPLGQLPKALIQQDARQYPTALSNEAIMPLNLPGPGAAGGPGGLGPVGQPGQMGNEFAPPQMVQQRQIVREEILEGKLFLRAVDPYNFYWLPGSKMNAWTGTIEEIEIPKWELLQMAQEGLFDMDLVRSIQPMKIEEQTKQSWLRWGEMPRTTNGPTPDTGVIKLTEFYGPIVIDGEVQERWGHILIANDTVTLINGKNQFWHRKAPYVGFSPVALPFRTEGVGLVEMVRQIDKAMNRLANMSVDTLMFRLMPVFEVAPDAYENPEDFDTGLTPGKIFRRNLQYPGAEGLKPIQMNDISQGSVQLESQLNVAHQEGSLISQIQQAIPRYRGAQSATESQAMQDNQQSFFGAMAADIERQFLAPIVMMSVDLIYQFLDTANDPRVASILGVEAGVLAGMTREEIMELVQGDYKVHVQGITGQLEKAEMLQSLVQFMNLIGQNPQAWLPYINQSKLLQRILEAFRPAIHDIEEILADPETAAAQQQAMFGQQITPDLLRLIPDLVRLQHQRSDAQFDQAQTKAEHQADLHQQAHDQYHDEVDKALQIGRLQLDHQQAAHDTLVNMHQATTARLSAEQTPQSAGVSSSPTQSGQGN